MSGVIGDRRPPHASPAANILNSRGVQFFSEKQARKTKL